MRGREKVRVSERGCEKGEGGSEKERKRYRVFSHELVYASREGLTSVKRGVGGGERRTERAWRRVRTGSARVRAARREKREGEREREKEIDAEGSETDASDRDGGRYI